MIARLRIQEPSVAMTGSAASTGTDSHHSLPTLARATDSLSAITGQVSRLIWQDELTQIGNRRSFDQVLDREWQRSIEEKSTLAVFLCDVDFFKKFNDTYGHLEGDRCLQQVARAIQSTAVPANGFVARYGGEEFAVILPNTDVDRALHLARSICLSVKDLGISHASSTVSDCITLSVGVAIESPQHNSLPLGAAAAADQALYQAKSMGRNQAKLFDSIIRTLSSSDELIA